MEHEIVTDELLESQLRMLLPQVIECLRGLGPAQYTVEYGWGCELPIESLWQPQNVHLEEFEAVLSRSEQAGIFHLGRGDIILRINDSAMVLTFSHHCDIRLLSGSAPLLEALLLLLRSKEVKAYQSFHPIGSPRQWQLIG